MELRDKDGIHGEQYVRIVNSEINGWGGIAQDGKFFQTDISYHFSGYLRSVSGNDTVEIRLTTGRILTLLSSVKGSDSTTSLINTNMTFLIPGLTVWLPSHSS
jgi:hypothetical protein